MFSFHLEVFDLFGFLTQVEKQKRVATMFFHCDSTLSTVKLLLMFLFISHNSQWYDHL